jgi:hypothetical protein
LRDEIATLKARVAAVPFIDTWDLRYANRVDQPTPSSQAVMFCVLDVSGSMDENRKNIAKRFFMLLYLFLTKSYERIELVFIRHHTVASEVDEEDFFSARESGGTVVSSALTLMHEIIRSATQCGLEHLCRAGFRRRQLGTGFDACRELIEPEHPAAGAVLRLCRDRGGGAAKPVARIRAHRGGQSPFRHAAHPRAGGHLSGVP